MSIGKDHLEQVDRHLSMPCLSWLLGAGVSYGANIPLMYPLTKRVLEVLAGTPEAAAVEAMKEELPDDAHVEHILSHLGDYAALADRSKKKNVLLGGVEKDMPALSKVHSALVRAIADTIRWGYVPATATAPARVGDREHPLVQNDGHRAFARATFRRARAGLEERRGPVKFFTTNYDTLLEDALALECIPCWDGFGGGAVAFRAHRYGEEIPTGYQAHVVKLHGSIDWHVESDGRVWRVRYGDVYPGTDARVLIYPQSTKYLATQRDPFAAQFDLLRRTLAEKTDNVLAACGYSFGDEHVNLEIEMGMSRQESRTTLIAFCRETPSLPECLERWRNGPWGTRVYVLSQNGLYVGKAGPFFVPAASAERGWWTFEGATQVIQNGAESMV